jgi:hypothetical protein
MATAVTINRYKGFKVVGAYDDTNGNDVTNNTGLPLYVGLTTTDGITEDPSKKTFLKPGDSVSFASGLGAGISIIVYLQDNGSVIEPSEIVAS